MNEGAKEFLNTATNNQPDPETVEEAVDQNSEDEDSEYSDGEEEAPFAFKENMVKKDHTTLFCNKYETDINLPTVINRMADIIIDYEANHNIIGEVEDEIDLEYFDDSNDNNIATVDIEECYRQRIGENEIKIHHPDDIINVDENEEVDTSEILGHPEVEDIGEDLNEDINIKKRGANLDRTWHPDVPSLTDSEDYDSDEDNNTNEHVSLSPQKKTVKLKHLKKHVKPSIEESKQVSEKAKEKTKKIKDRMEKIGIAPGEGGGFKNWGDDIFLEEKCFPSLFPYGYGGYLSSNMESGDSVEGFAKYVKGRIMSTDPKFRQDYIYMFFLLLVKELVQLKRCKTTYLRQARKLPNLTKDDVLNTDKYNLSRYDRSYSVFKTMRGTSMYYEDSKKKLMAMLHQKGCPSLFMTITCAEYKWKELVRQILETEWNQTVTMEYVNSLTDGERNHIVSRSAIQSTCHFQKRVEKLFNFVKYTDELFGEYSASDYYYRIEFQAR